MRRAFGIALFCALLASASAGAAQIEVSGLKARAWGGDMIALTIRVADVERTPDMQIAWALVYGEATLAKGTLPVPETGDVEMKLESPKVDNRIETKLGLALNRDGETLAGAERPLQLFPRGALDGLKGLFEGKKVGLIDPNGRLKLVSEQVPVTWTPLRSELEAGHFDGPVAVLAPDTALAAANAAVPMKSSLEDGLLTKVQDGLTLVCLAQKERPLTLEAMSPTFNKVERAKARILDAEHPILRSMRPGDLEALWSETGDEGAVIAWPKAGSYRVIIDTVGGQEPATVLLELRHGTGRILFCQMPVAESYDSDPLAELLLGDLLRWSLASPSALEPATVKFGEASPWLKALKELRVEESDGGKGPILAQANAALAGPDGVVKTVLKEGGAIVLFGLTPDDLPKLSDLFRERWGADTRAPMPRFELHPFAAGTSVAADAPVHPLLAGIRPEDIAAAGRWHANAEGNVYTVAEPGDPEHFRSLIGEGLVAKFERDNARICFCQIPIGEIEDSAALRRLVGPLLTNLGIRLADSD